MIYEIYESVLLVDELPPDIVSTYTVDPDEVKFYYAGGDRVDKCSDENVFVPLIVEPNQDWNMILMKLLNKCNKTNIRVKQPTWNLWNKAQEIFAEHDTVMTNIIAHPGVVSQTPILTGVFTTEHCPKNLMFILPPPDCLGVVPRTGTAQGMAIINPSLVIKVRLPGEPAQSHISLLDTLITL